MDAMGLVEKFFNYLGLGLLAVGLLFDMLTLAALISTLRGRRSSAVTIIGTICYPAFLLLVVSGMFGGTERSTWLWIGGTLLLFHLMLASTQRVVFDRFRQSNE